MHFKVKNGTEKDVPVPTEDDTSELLKPDKVSGWPALRTEAKGGSRAIQQALTR